MIERIVVAVLLLLAQVPPAVVPAAATAEAEPPPPAAPVRVELAVEVLDTRGDPLPDVAAAGLTVLEDGVPSPGVLAPSTAPWRLVVYVDRVLASPATVRAAASALADAAAALAAVGTVEIVVAEPEPRVVLAPTREPAAVEEALSRVFFDVEGRDDLRAMRRRFLEEGTAAVDAAAVEEAVAAEARLASRQAARLGEWLAAADRSGPAALLLVSDGFDLDPTPFYLQAAPGADARAAARETSRVLAEHDPAAASRDVARAAAALGWTVLPLPVGGEGVPQLSRFRLSSSEEVQMQVGVTLGRRKDDEGEAAREPAVPLLLDPTAPLAELAEATGGEVVKNPLAIADAVTRLGGRARLIYESLRAGDGRTRAVEVRSADPSLAVKARHWDGPAMPQELAELRARHLLAGDGEAGDLPVSAAVRLLAPSGAELTAGAAGAAGEARQATLELAADLSEIAATGAGVDLARQVPLRVTVTSRAHGLSIVDHQVVTVPDLAAPEGWSWQGEVPVAGGADRLAVVVEPLAGGPWGGDVVAVLSPEGEAAAALVPVLSTGPPPAAAPPVVRLVAAAGQTLGGLLSGKVRLRAVLGGVAEAEATRVAFFVDGRRAAACSRPPCEATVDLGRTVRPHALQAVAYSADGRELGRDTLRVNARRGGLSVRIVEPGSGQGVGPVDVAADVDVPAGRRLDRVEFFWNDELAATVYAAPFRRRVLVPAARPVGYLRVVARLDDGTTADDALVMNAPTAGARVDVELVELLVVVTDATGKPVRGLPRDRFRVLQDGREQEISSFENVGDFPLSLGLAIDSSASMFRKLPSVQQAARSLLAGSLSAKDSALLIDFDSEPRLVRPLTQNLAAVGSALDLLQADRGTDLWEAVVFSLTQLSGVTGRKALIVYADGVDENEDLPFRTCLRAARESGVPIYLILSRTGLARAEGGVLLRSYAEKLEELTAATGGRIYFAPPERDLGDVYREILAELRSQYLLAYYPRETAGEAFREVEVEVAGEGLTARTLSGYYAER